MPPSDIPTPANVNKDLRPRLIAAAQRYSLGLAAEPGSIAATLFLIDRVLPPQAPPKLTVIDGGRSDG